MILSTPSPFHPSLPPLYYCDHAACLSKLLMTLDGQPVTRAHRVPMTATCAACGVNLFLRAAVPTLRALEAK